MKMSEEMILLNPTTLAKPRLEEGRHWSYLQYASQLSVEEAHKLFAPIVLLGESEDHAANRSQQLDGAHLIHVLLWHERWRTELFRVI